MEKVENCTAGSGPGECQCCFLICDMKGSYWMKFPLAATLYNFMAKYKIDYYLFL